MSSHIVQLSGEESRPKFANVCVNPSTKIVSNTLSCDNCMSSKGENLGLCGISGDGGGTVLSNMGNLQMLQGVCFVSQVMHLSLVQEGKVWRITLLPHVNLVDDLTLINSLFWLSSDIIKPVCCGVTTGLEYGLAFSNLIDMNVFNSNLIVPSSPDNAFFNRYNDGREVVSSHATVFPMSTTADGYTYDVPINRYLGNTDAQPSPTTAVLSEGRNNTEVSGCL